MNRDIYTQIETVGVLEKRVEKAGTFELKTAAMALAKAQRKLSVLLAKAMADLEDRLKIAELRTK
ncbi:transcription factor [Pseudoalteromonas phage Cr39582]|uniref:Transcription factor n=1 Tax=Pseudoalteromonas phage Cr39582 TaxID=2099852 RepID=A0A2P1CKY8_9VIRU|nr:transcription factor [Pseudoalteromonas phage Cr39582]AVJ51869.1 transcription factor [Pseudoalteromonas phage Cr39582]